MLDVVSTLVEHKKADVSTKITYLAVVAVGECTGKNGQADANYLEGHRLEQIGNSQCLRGDVLSA